MKNPISNRYFANVSFVENDHDTAKVSTISKGYDGVDKISSADSNIELDRLPSQKYNFGKGESSSLLALLDVDDDLNNDAENDVSTIVLAPNVINMGKHGSVKEKVKSSESSKNKPQKKKRVKKMKPPPPQELTNLIPKVPTQQSRAHAQLLFDYIAPHVDKHVMEYLLIKMREFEVQMRNELEIKEQQQELESSHGASKKKKISKQKLKEYKTLVGRLDAFFSSKDPNTKKMKKMGTQDNAGLEKHPWIKSLIAQFFAGSPSRENKEDTPVKENMPASLSMEFIWQDPTFTPNLNRKKYEEAVSTLMRAREMSLESPLLWSNNQRKRVKKQTVEEKWEMVRREKHYGKSPQELKVEAETMANILSFRLPVDAHDELLRLFKGYADNVKETIMNEHETKIKENDVELFDDQSIRKDNNDDNMSLDIERKDGPKRHVEIMKMLFPNLKRRVGFHMHLVAMELAEFFYVDVPEQTRSEVEAVAIPETVDGIPYFPIGRSDVRISESWNNWNSLRDDVANVFLSSQHMYIRLHSALKKGESSRKGKHDTNDSKHPTEQEIDNVMAQYSNEANERTEELVEQLDKLRTTENDEVVGGIHLENVKKGPSSKPINLRFDCLMLNEKFGPYSYTDTSLLADLGGLHSNNMAKVSQDIAAILPETNKIIFIENLPIDVTKDELMTLYSRCGPIESLEIYNLRPELDPGELSLKKTAERKKRRRMSGMKGAKHKSKSRTPVYAFIKFRDEEGYNKATIDILRIFGMVIRRHLVKSIPARNINTIYLENISSSLHALDFEQKFNEILQPDMYISLSMGQRVNSDAKSCEISFPSFEVAYYAHQKLQTIDI
eukprot:CAMPEP_0176498828 /NCGR_PEP_ID=MMETSP0200_2-20121128/12562_1 /TAXON_ID=947934 /ORGANISM="Chaetoceros sp., Strain GSL56" /LENGTH=839 /DNA_ID=CAMNT_0017897127 /DNA_START=414 /DNA_END=2930 /DNA_ORIENTATION=-